MVENEVEAREVVEELFQVGIPEAGALNNTNWRATSTKVVVVAIVIITEMSNNTSVFRRLSFPVFAVSQSLETGEPDPLYFVLNVS